MSSEKYHYTLHGAQSQIQDVKLVKYGRVTSYDPDKNAVKVLVMQDFGTDDEPAETDWIPLGTFAVGDQWGFQYAPVGGASPDDPEQGELCVVFALQRNTGLTYTAHLIYDQAMVPPGSSENDEDSEQDDDDKAGWDDDPKGLKKLEGGECIFRSKEGTFLKFYKDGDLQIYTAKDLHCYTKQEANIVVREGDLNVTLDKGDMKVSIAKGDMTVFLAEGDATMSLAKGDANINLDEGDLKAKAGGDITLDAGGDLNLKAAGDLNITVGVEL